MLEYEVDQRVGSILLAKRVNQELSVVNAQLEATKRIQQAVQSQTQVQLAPPSGIMQGSVTQPAAVQLGMQKPPQTIQHQHSGQLSTPSQFSQKPTNISHAPSISPSQFKGQSPPIQSQQNIGVPQLIVVPASDNSIETRQQSMSPNNMMATSQHHHTINDPPSEHFQLTGSVPYMQPPL